MCRRPPTSPLFPYTTLFRSGVGVAVLVESDLVERGELAVVAGHDLVGAHDVGLGREGLHRSEEHTSELQSHVNLVCRLLLEKKKAPPQLIGLITPHHAGTDL